MTAAIIAFALFVGVIVYAEIGYDFRRRLGWVK